MIGFSFIHLIRTDSNAFFLIAEWFSTLEAENLPVKLFKSLKSTFPLSPMEFLILRFFFVFFLDERH